MVEPTHLKNMLVKMGSSSQSKGETKKYLSCHHLDLHCFHHRPHFKKIGKVQSLGILTHLNWEWWTMEPEYDLRFVSVIFVHPKPSSNLTFGEAFGSLGNHFLRDFLVLFVSLSFSLPNHGTNMRRFSSFSWAAMARKPLVRKETSKTEVYSWSTYP